MPFTKIVEWLEEEKKLGSSQPDRAVLATASSQAIPHSRIVAIREMVPAGVLFFTQRGTKKVVELTENPLASMTFWFAIQQRQVIIDGMIEPLTQHDNERYWKSMPHDRQLRFSAYAPTSGQPIASLAELETRYKKLSEQFEGKDVPLSDFYCGYRLIPDSFYFYTLGTETFSEVIKYFKHQDGWMQQQISP